MRDFHNYKVWEKGHQFALHIYRKTKSFPKDELFGITSQIRRAATSISFNIAEGCGRRSDAEFAYFLNIAAGSASEVEEELLLSYDLEYMDSFSYHQLDKEVNDIKAMLNKLIETLQ
ncbi:MAG: four helix bundle protein [Bacteroidales bacterium]|nr:four helix bundle protein [Bacteroidales bacterium]